MSWNVMRLSAFTITALFSVGCTTSPDAKVAKFLATGKQYYTARDYRRAILEFKNAVVAKPREAEPYYQLGLGYMAAGDLASAMAAFRKTTELNPNHSGAKAKLANILVATRDSNLIKQGEELAQQAVAAQPNDADALNSLALAELKTGKPADAFRHFELALEKLPQSLKAAANLASIKLSRKDFAGAEDVLKKAAAQMQKSSKPLIALGRFYLVVNRPADAEAQFRSALELDPKDAVAMRDLAEFLYLQGRTAQAEDIYKRLSALPYKASKPLYAMFLYKIGKSDMATVEFEKLLAQDPKDRDVRTYLVSAYFLNGKLADAAKVIAAALKNNPKDAEALLQHGLISLASGQYEDAERDAQAVLHFKSDSGTAHYVLAKVYHAHGGANRRREELSLALKSNPALLQARLELNQALIEANALPAALNLLDQAPTNQKGTVGYLISRNWTLMAMGDWAELRKGIDEGLRLANASELLLQDGMLRVQQRDYKNAQKSLDQVLQRNPEDLRALKVLGGVYVLQNQSALALQAVQERVQRRPSSAVLQNYLGELLLANGQTAQAKAAFLAAKAADPNLRAADLSLAQVDLAQNNVDGARNKLLNLSKSKGAGVSALLALASVEQSAGKVDESAGHYRAVLQQDANNLIALNNLAFLLAEIPGQTDEALQHAQRAKELAPNDPMITDTLGWVFVQKKMPRPAIEQLESAVSKRPVAPIYYHLAVAYLQAGESGRARDRLMSALKLDPRMPEALSVLRHMDGSDRH